MFLPSRLLDRGDGKVRLRRVTKPAGLYLQASEIDRGQVWTLSGHFSSAAASVRLRDTDHSTAVFIFGYSTGTNPPLAKTKPQVLFQNLRIIVT